MFPRGRLIRNACLLVALFCRGGVVAPARAQGPEVRRPLASVTPGTPAADSGADRWNRLVLAAVPRIATGDTDSVPQMVRDNLPRFTLVVMATVRAAAGPGGAVRHELAEVGAGYALPVAGRLTVVDTEAPPPEAGLDFLGRTVLAQNGRALSGLSSVGASETIRVFDAESILVAEGRHRDYLMRHFVWVEPASGHCSTCVWLLGRRPDGTLDVVDVPPRWIPPGTREDRAIHVDAGEFALGLPTKRAFALVDMPPGPALPWSPGLRTAAAAPACTPEVLRTLAVELDRGLEALRRAAAP